MSGDWEDVALEDVAELSGGYAFKSGEYSPEGRFVLRTLNINEDGSIHKDSAVFLPLEKCDQYKRFELQEHDTLFVMVGATLGKVGYVRREALPALLNQNMWRIRARDGFCDGRYLQYAFRDTVAKRLGWASGSARDFVRRDDYRTMKIPVPPLPEQKRIAHILGTLDDKIELNRRMNATLEAMARALFQSWFVDFDPVRRNAARAQNQPSPSGRGRSAAEGEGASGIRNAEGATPRPEDSLFPDSFEDSAMGEIPKGWKLIPLYETATYRNGAPFKAKDFCAPGEGLPVVKIAELKNGLTDTTKWSLKELGDDQMIGTGDLLYSWSGSPDTSLDAFLWTDGRGLVNQHIFKVITSSDAEKRYVYYLLKHLRPILVETARDKQTTGLGHVTVADMKRLQVSHPPKEVLDAFNQLIAPIYDRAFCNTLENQTLVILRDTLLPKLLGGELKVKQ